MIREGENRKGEREGDDLKEEGLGEEEGKEIEARLHFAGITRLRLARAFT